MKNPLDPYLPKQHQIQTSNPAAQFGKSTFKDETKKIAGEDLPRNPFNSSQFQKRSGSKSPLTINTEERPTWIRADHYSKTPTNNHSNNSDFFPMSTGNIYTKHLPLYHSKIKIHFF